MTTLISVRPKTLDLELYAGDSFAIGFVFTDEAGNPWPLTGTWKAQIRNRTAVVTEFLVDESELNAGKVKLSLTGEQTADLATQAGCSHVRHASTCANCLVWDLEQDFSGGPRTWYNGSISVARDVTRPVVP